MRAGLLRDTALIGAGLTVLNTLVSVSADALAKDLIAAFEAPQLMVIAGAVALLMGLAASAGGHAKAVLGTPVPGLVALRSAFGMISTLGFFYAFRYLAFAEVFLFVAIMPLFAAILSVPLLGERLSRPAWLALAMGLGGMLFLASPGQEVLGIGHLAGLFAALTGTVSLVLSRKIGRIGGTHVAAQVFYGQLACLIGGAMVLPFTYAPMSGGAVALVVLYALCLIATRWLMVVILRLMPAHAVMQISQVQFLWMVVIGQGIFGEATSAHIWLGAGLVIAAGLWLVQMQRRLAGSPTAAQPSEREADTAAAAGGGVGVLHHEARPDQLVGKVDHRILQKRQRYLVDQHPLAIPLQHQIAGGGFREGDLVLETRASAPLDRHA